MLIMGMHIVDDQKIREQMKDKIKEARNQKAIHITQVYEREKLNKAYKYSKKIRREQKKDLASQDTALFKRDA